MGHSFPSALLLDSGGGWSEGNGNSFILFKNPSFSFFSSDGISEVNFFDRSFKTTRDPIAILEGYLSEGYIAVGYFGYEFSRFTEYGFVPCRKKEGDLFPDLYFLFYKEEDLISGGIKELKYLLETRNERRSSSTPKKVRIHSNIGRRDYINIVKRVKNYIQEGDIYQVNLSQRFTINHKIFPIDYFLDLYEVQPVPFACYMDFGEFKLISGSMELFLERSGNKILTKPIKGTARRDSDPRIDILNREDLEASEKEKAENLMIVDLMRNDLGRICKIGTVNVNELFRLNTYTTLYHMESEIEGALRNGASLAEIINKTFPPGSVTGAPKSRALEIIDELEPHFRGPYCGTIGIFYPDGDFKLSVAIRVLVSSNYKTVYWVGGGIVWDSDPEREYLETLLKARAIQRSMTA